MSKEQCSLGHKRIETTMIYTHITPDYKHANSPLDRLKRKQFGLEAVGPLLRVNICFGEIVSGFGECRFWVSSSH